MATSQNPKTPRRRRLGDRSRPDPVTPPRRDPTPENLTEPAGGATGAVHPHEHTAGHPRARGTLPMARYLTDPAIEEEIQALAREAPPMTEDQRAKLARLLRLNRRHPDRRAA